MSRTNHLPSLGDRAGIVSSASSLLPILTLALTGLPGTSLLLPSPQRRTG